MQITVKLLSTFAKYYSDPDSDKITIEDCSTVQDLVEQLGIPRKRVRIITINGKQSDINAVLSDGDLVYLLPPALGGG